MHEVGLTSSSTTTCGIAHKFDALTDLKELPDLPNDRPRIRFELQIKYILKLSAFRLNLELQPDGPFKSILQSGAHSPLNSLQLDQLLVKLDARRARVHKGTQRLVQAGRKPNMIHLLSW